MNPYEYKTVYRLWNSEEIILMTFTQSQMIADAKRLNLKGFMEEAQMPLYLIELLLKDIAKRRKDIN